MLGAQYVLSHSTQRDPIRGLLYTGGLRTLNAPCYRSWYKHTLVNDGYDYGKGAPYVLYNPPPPGPELLPKYLRTLLPELV